MPHLIQPRAADRSARVLFVILPGAVRRHLEWKRRHEPEPFGIDAQAGPAGILSMPVD